MINCAFCFTRFVKPLTTLIIIENSLKQELTLREINEKSPSGSLVIGHDAHSVEELAMSHI